MSIKAHCFWLLPLIVHPHDRIYSVDYLRTILESSLVNQEKTITKLLGKNIRRLRQQKSWSQMLLAAEAGLDKSYVGGIERGEFNPSVKKVAKLADTLGVAVGRLFEKP